VHPLPAVQAKCGSRCSTAQLDGRLKSSSLSQARPCSGLDGWRRTSVTTRPAPLRTKATSYAIGRLRSSSRARCTTCQEALPAHARKLVHASRPN